VDPFSRKIASICNCLVEEECRPASILLIGVDEKEPLTIIDGNHRFVAAVLAGRMHQLRFLCGLSPKMRSCCWYKTNLRTLARYAANLLAQCFQNPEAELAQLCTEPVTVPTAEVVVMPTMPVQDQMIEERAS
jgi:hypothetical protein